MLSWGASVGAGAIIGHIVAIVAFMVNAMPELSASID
jgi:hypothetical protein